ncbi:MAG: aldo/keto reductase [Gammaproteobacteria bacterium]
MMIDKIILGTANFVKPYGILSNGAVFSQDQASSILSYAYHNGVCILDTALGYGNITQKVDLDLLKSFKIITKISVLEDEQKLLEEMKIYKGLNIYGVLIHDPHNLMLVKASTLRSNLKLIQSEYSIKKIGVSAYDLLDIEKFQEICTPDIVQIPLNPLSQTFNCQEFIEYVKAYEIEVHARSLFLQGLLLLDQLPEKLAALYEAWSSVQDVLKQYPSPLHGLLTWALAQNWVDNWVLGTSSMQELQAIIKNLPSKKNKNEHPIFQINQNPLADPRNW